MSTGVDQVKVSDKEEFEPRKMKFSWSCAPISYSMRCLGIALDFAPRAAGNNCSASSFRVGYWLTTLFGLLMFIVNLAILTNSIHSTFFWLYSDDTAKDRKTISSTMIWNWIITLFNGSLITLGTQMALLASTLINWKYLTATFYRIEKSKQLTRITFKQIRRTCEWGLVFILMDVTIFFITLIIKTYRNANVTDSLMKNLVKSLHEIFILYPYCAGLCFVCLGWIVSIMLDTLDEQYHYEQARTRVNDGMVQWKTQLIKWKHHYLDICELIEQINRCFGIFLFIFITAIYVRTITTSFAMMVSLRGPYYDSIVFYPLQLLQDHIHFITVVYIPNRIHQRAAALIRRLQQIQTNDTTVQTQLDFLLLKFSKNLPKITARGFFRIDLHLVPTLIGTTLTYLIILFQFQAAERIGP